MTIFYSKLDRNVEYYQNYPGKKKMSSNGRWVAEIGAFFYRTLHKGIELRPMTLFTRERIYKRQNEIKIWTIHK